MSHDPDSNARPVEFHDRDRHATTAVRETALACLEAGVTAALPERVVPGSVALDGETLRIHADPADREAAYDLGSYDELLVLGGGKAAGGIAAALEAILGDRIDDGLVVTTGADADRTLASIDVRAGDHPTPTRRNVEATTDLLELAADAGDRTLVLAVVAGGASALLCAPADGEESSAAGLSLDDLRETTDALLRSGARIDEVNAVRRCVSAVKGGRLVTRAAPATVCTLAISDVVGDDPAVIGSGPTVPTPTTAAAALDVLDRYGLRADVPPAVADHVESSAGTSTESVAAGDAMDYHLLASGRTAIEAARGAARERGYETTVLSSRFRGEASEVGRLHAAVAAEIHATGEPVAPPAVVLSGGEVTVTVDGAGTGGPNQELALAAGIELDEARTRAVLGSVDTDGIDGPTDAAGALVDGETVAGEYADAQAALLENDAWTYLEARDALLRAGYTGTNVNDLRVLVVE